MRNIEMYLEDFLAPTDAGYKEPLYLTPENGYVPQNLNLGSPEVRENMSSRPSANGEFDNTEFHGARAVSAMIGLAGRGAIVTTTDEDLEDALREWMQPRNRMYLVYRRPEQDWRRIFLSPRACNAPKNFRTDLEFTMLALGWKSPTGVSESLVETIESINAAGTTELGRAYSLAFPRDYPDSPVVGSKPIDYTGTSPLQPIIRIYGPVTQPRFENITTGLKMEFAVGYVIAAGNYVEIDMFEGTAFINSDESQSVYHQIDFSVSDWWELIKGENLIRFYPAVATSPAVMQIYIRPKYA